MKKIISYILMFAMLAGLFITTEYTDAATKLKVAKKKVTVRVKESVKVKYTSAKKPKVTSKNKKIAKAKVKGKNIVITGVKKGKTNVTVKAAGKSAVIKVTVKKEKKTDTPESLAEPTATPYPTTNPQLVDEALKKMEPYALSVNKFSFGIFNNLKKDDSNTFASPFSLYMALAMLANGTDGNTKNELLSAMGINDLSEFNNNAKYILAGSSDEKVTLNIANAVWTGNRFELAADVEKDFFEPVKNYYNADIKKDVDLMSQDFVDDVNQWADEKTNGMIKKVLAEPLDEGAAMLLANAVYFLGTWTNPFRTEATAEKEFNGVKGKKKIQMMLNGGVYGKYFKNDSFVGASLPYGNGNYEMDILMSADTSTTAGKVWNSLSADDKAKTFANFSVNENSKKINVLQLPKFELEGDYGDELIQALNNIGVKDLFNSKVSDLSKIGKDFFVSKIAQKAKLKVDEKGTEAAAVTTIAVGNASIEKPVEWIEFIVDRPFIFAIRDRVSGMILFIGEVNDL